MVKYADHALICKHCGGVFYREGSKFDLKERFLSALFHYSVALQVSQINDVR